MQKKDNLMVSLKDKETYYLQKLQYIKEEKDNILLCLKSNLKKYIEEHPEFYDKLYSRVSKKIGKNKIQKLLYEDYEEFVKTVYINNTILVKISKGTNFYQYATEIKEDEEIIKSILLTLYYDMIFKEVHRYSLFLNKDSYSVERLLRAGESAFFKAFIKFNYKKTKKISTYFLNIIKREIYNEVEKIIIDRYPNILFRYIDDEIIEKIKKDNLLSKFFKNRSITVTTLNELIQRNYIRKEILKYFKEHHNDKYLFLENETNSLVELAKELICYKIPELGNYNKTVTPTIVVEKEDLKE